jgi:hypothetical protein
LSLGITVHPFKLKLIFKMLLFFSEIDWVPDEFYKFLNSKKFYCLNVLLDPKVCVKLMLSKTNNSKKSCNDMPDVMLCHR